MFVSGGEIVSTFGKPELVKLGTCKLIEEVMIGEDKVGPSGMKHHFKIDFNRCHRKNNTDLVRCCVGI